VHLLRKPKEFSVEFAFFASLDLAGVGSALAWMNAAHVPAQGLAGVEHLIARLAIISLKTGLRVLRNDTDIFFGLLNQRRNRHLGVVLALLVLCDRLLHLLLSLRRWLARPGRLAFRFDLEGLR